MARWGPLPHHTLPTFPRGQWGFQIAWLITAVYGPPCSPTNTLPLLVSVSPIHSIFPPPLQNTRIVSMRCNKIGDLGTGLLTLAELLEGGRCRMLCVLHRFSLLNSASPGGGIIPILRTDPKSKASSSAAWESRLAGLTLSPPSPYQALRAASSAPSAISGSPQSPRARGV